jgi:TetR/AcrR family transcriptional repressor of nem operon
MVMTKTRFIMAAATIQLDSQRHESKTRILQAALEVIRTKGYTATRVEDICAAANLTKGSFFHHFKTKEEMAVAAADYWAETTSGLFATAPYQTVPDPLGRLLAYIDFRKSILRGDLQQFTCLVGTMVQEIYLTHPEVAAACDRSIRDHAATLVPLITQAMAERDMDPDWSAESLALYTQASIQGAFILAKAQHSPTIAVQCVDHLRRYVELLFQQPKKQA